MLRLKIFICLPLAETVLIQYQEAWKLQSSEDPSFFFFFLKLHPLSCLFLTILRISGSETLTPGYLVTCYCMGFPWCESVIVPKRLREKVQVSHVHIECQRSLAIEENQLFSGMEVHCVLQGEFFPPLFIFLSSLDSLPPASNLFKVPLCKQTHQVLPLLKRIFSMVLMAN